MVVTGVLGGDGRRPSMHVDVGERGGSCISSSSSLWVMVTLLSAAIVLGDMGGEDGCCGTMDDGGASLRRHCSEQ